MNFAQKLFLLTPLLIMLGGGSCVPQRRPADPEKLFTKDACDVYRFFDTGNYHYFVDCHGRIIHERVDMPVVRSR